MRVDGEKYYPNNSSDCSQDPWGFCDWRMGQAHNINGPWKYIGDHRSITVGLEEHDTTSGNDSASAMLQSSEWHSPTCDLYEVQLSYDFE